MLFVNDVWIVIIVEVPNLFKFLSGNIKKKTIGACDVYQTCSDEDFYHYHLNFSDDEDDDSDSEDDDDDWW